MDVFFLNTVYKLRCWLQAAAELEDMLLVGPSVAQLAYISVKVKVKVKNVKIVFRPPVRRIWSNLLQVRPLISQFRGRYASLLSIALFSFLFHGADDADAKRRISGRKRCTV